jgi:hypothetical protein
MDSARHVIECHATQRLMDSARHVMGCRLTQETRVQNAFDDVESTIHQSLGGGGHDAGSCRAQVARHVVKRI